MIPLMGRVGSLGEQVNAPAFVQGQAQECLLEKSMLDNRKSFLVARISAQVGMGVGGGPKGTESRP